MWTRIEIVDNRRVLIRRPLGGFTAALDEYFCYDHEHEAEVVRKLAAGETLSGEFQEEARCASSNHVCIPSPFVPDEELAALDEARRAQRRAKLKAQRAALQVERARAEEEWRAELTERQRRIDRWAEEQAEWDRLEAEVADLRARITE